MNRVLFVTGMHRSGTSATAGLLAHLGLYPGRQRDLLPPNAFNPNGYWEHHEVVALNDAALAPVGGWSSPAPLPSEQGLPKLMRLRAREAVLRQLRLEADGQPILVKDPRLCRLMPEWLAAARSIGLEPSVLWIHRNRAAVVRSLCRREGWEQERAVELVQTYLDDMDEAFPLGEHRERLRAVRFEDILRNWSAALDEPLRCLLPEFHCTADDAAAADEFLRKGGRSA